MAAMASNKEKLSMAAAAAKRIGEGIRQAKNKRRNA
jgi:hypothetical protein